MTYCGFLKKKKTFFKLSISASENIVKNYKVHRRRYISHINSLFIFYKPILTYHGLLTYLTTIKLSGINSFWYLFIDEEEVGSISIDRTVNWNSCSSLTNEKFKKVLNGMHTK